MRSNARGAARDSRRARPHALGEHRFAVGEYVTINDEDGRPLTYKVVEIQKAR